MLYKSNKYEIKRLNEHSLPQKNKNDDIYNKIKQNVIYNIK